MPSPARPRTRLWALPCGGERAPRSLLDPLGARADETIFLPYFLYAIDHPSGLVLFDCGAHGDFARPGGRRRRAAGAGVVEVGRDDALATVLREIGFAPRQVAVVIVSHLHYDHCGGLAQMSGSDVYAGAAELGFASAPSPEQQAAYWPGDWEAVAADRWKLIDQEHDVLGDGSVVIVPTPGHTPGHISLLVRLQRHTLLLAGDAAYDIGAIRQRRLPGYLWDAEAVASSWQRIEELEGSEGAGIILSHEILPGARIGPGEWYE